MAINDLYSLQIRTAVGVEFCYNKLLYRVASQVTPDNQLGAVLNELWRTQVVVPLWAPLMGNGWFINQLYTRRVFPLFAPPAVDTFFFGGVGPDEPIPPTSPMCLSLYTDKAGRSQRGRIWVSGLAKFRVNSGLLTVAGFALAQDLGAGLLSVPDPFAPPGDRFELMVQRDPVGMSGLCDSIRVNPEMRVMRSRTPRPRFS